MQPERKHRLSLAAALVTMFVWGMNFAFVKHVLERIGVEAFMFIRFAALPVLGLVLLLAVFRSRVAHTWPRREDLRTRSSAPARRKRRSPTPPEGCG